MHAIEKYFSSELPDPSKSGLSSNWLTPSDRCTLLITNQACLLLLAVEEPSTVLQTASWLAVRYPKLDKDDTLPLSISGEHWRAITFLSYESDVLIQQHVTRWGLVQKSSASRSRSLVSSEDACGCLAGIGEAFGRSSSGRGRTSCACETSRNRGNYHDVEKTCFSDFGHPRESL